MKTLRKLTAALAAFCFLAVAAFAADASPAGTWKWTQQGRQGQGMERTLKLELKDGKLSGTVLGTQGGQFQIPDTAIADATFKDGVIAFTVTNEFNGNKRTSKYEGKLAGDTITGTIERPGRDGQTQKNDWVAKRADAK